MQQQVQLGDVIDLVVANCPDLNSPRDVCSLLLVDSTRMQQLQKPAAKGHISVRGKQMWWSREDLLSRMTAMNNFVDWLPQHAGLVTCLDLRDARKYPHLYSPEVPVQQQQLVFALRLCRLSAMAGSTAAQNLHLHTLHCAGLVMDALLLEELEFAGLQELDLSYAPPAADGRLAAALAKLTSLRRLTLDCSDHEKGIFVTEALSQLTQLTDLCAVLPDFDSLGGTLPPSLQHVDIAINCDGDDWCLGPPLDLQHMTALQRLVLKNHETPSLKLPPQLTYLSSFGRVQQLSGGARLLHAELHIHSGEAQELLHYLNGLPHLQCLDASVVHQTLEGDPEDPQSATAMQQISTPAWASSLTALLLSGSLEDDDVPCDCAALVKWYRHLSGLQLPKLTRLDLFHTYFQRDDLLRLTSFTSVTRLDLVYPGGLDDVVAVSLAVNLTGLQELYMTSASLSSVAVLPALAALPQLKALYIEGGDDFIVGDSDLMLLSRLTCLTQLSLTRKGWSSAGQERFLAVMPHLSLVT